MVRLFLGHQGVLGNEWTDPQRQAAYMQTGSRRDTNQAGIGEHMDHRPKKTHLEVVLMAKFRRLYEDMS
jgi:hypothetical protein